jgi:hypothetical protein
MNIRAKRSLLWLSAVVGPFAVNSTYLVLSRWLRATGHNGAIALSVAMLVGAVCIFLLMPSAEKKFIGLLLYVPAATILLMCYSFMFICAAFGDCL